MSSVKEIKARLRGVETIQKITKAMKMVAASRLRSAQRSSKQATLGLRAFPSFFQASPSQEGKKKQLILSVSSERGLCGSINTAVNKSTVYFLNELQSQAVSADLFILGSKSRDFFLRNCGSQVYKQLDQMGTKDVSFITASMAIEELVFSVFDQITIFFNVCESVVTQRVYAFNVLAFSLASKEVPGLLMNEIEEQTENSFDLFGDYYQLSWTYLFFYVLLQNRTSEQAARVNAMESASKNAGEIIQALRLFYNKARQSSITRELIEIISCANAMSGETQRVL